MLLSYVTDVVNVVGMALRAIVGEAYISRMSNVLASLSAS